MTIAVGIACPEGLVVAADSRTSYVTDQEYRVVPDYAHKVFELGTCAAATAGWAFLEGKTIAGHMDELRRKGRFGRG